MDFAVYEKATAGESVGDRFDGHASRTAIAQALGAEFSEEAGLAAPLARWGDATLGREGVFTGIDPKKWRFAVLRRPLHVRGVSRQ